MQRRTALEGVAGVLATVVVGVGVVLQLFREGRHSITVRNQSGSPVAVDIEVYRSVFGYAVLEERFERVIDAQSEAEVTTVDGVHRIVVRAGGRVSQTVVEGSVGGCTVYITEDGLRGFGCAA